MRINEHLGKSNLDLKYDTNLTFITALATSHVLLVPYSAHHVPTYHAWMQDEVCTPFSLLDHSSVKILSSFHSI